jgi:hypothetical protein
MERTTTSPVFTPTRIRKLTPFSWRNFSANLLLFSCISKAA